MNALIIRSQDDLAKFLTHEAKKWTLEHHTQIDYFVDQGSEKLGQDYMKRRYGNPTPIKKIHLEYAAT